MKSIEIDDDLYTFIASQTKHIGESASDILRRLLMPESPAPERATPATPEPVAESIKEQPEVTVADTSVEEPAAPVVADTTDQSAILASVTADSLAAYTKRVEQFLFILAQLHQLHPGAFSGVEQIKGKNRVYFATSKAALLENGSSTNPKAIPDSPYWVVTNNNTAKKIAMLEQVLQVLGYNDDVISSVTALFAPETVQA